jgi:hypothetical protein
MHNAAMPTVYVFTACGNFSFNFSTVAGCLLQEQQWSYVAIPAR